MKMIKYNKKITYKYTNNVEILKLKNYTQIQRLIYYSH